MNNNNLKQKIEVLLFMARNPLTEEYLAKNTEAGEEEVKTAVRQLIDKYSDPEFGIHIIHISGGYQFATKAEYAKTLELYINSPQEFSLSMAALETLVIIAYRQPITRAEVEAIRGVNSDGIMKSLFDKELVEEKGKSDTIGRPTLYGTTDNFLKHFGLNSLEDLPKDPLNTMNKNSEAAEKLAGFIKAIPEQFDLEQRSTESLQEAVTQQDITS
jgi:segregation and condensation protein B